MRMRHIIICGRDYLTKERFKKKSYLTQDTFQVSLKILSETFFIISRNERDIIKKYSGLHVNYPSFFSDFNEN